MTPPIALQLYTIRQQLQEGFEAGIRKIADMGYVGVEIGGGFPGTTPEAAAKLFRELGLAVPSAHLPLPVGEAKRETLDVMNALGAKRIVGGFGPRYYETMDGIRRCCDTFNEASAIAAENGMSLMLHNHWWEFERVEGNFVYQEMLKLLAPEIVFELDTYWIKTAGVDPAAIVREFGARAPMLHIKNGPATKDAPMTAVGDGVMDFHSIANAGGSAVEWMVVELDECATDMMEAVQKSYTYLTREKLAKGKI